MSWFNYPNFSCIKMVVNFDNCCVYFDWLKTITKKTPLMLLGGSYKYGCLTNSAKYISSAQQPHMASDFSISGSREREHFHPHGKFCWQCFNRKLKNAEIYRNFPGDPVVKNQPCNSGDAGLIPVQGTKVPHAAGQLSPHTTARV